MNPEQPISIIGRYSSRASFRGVTLVELLVVVGLISVLLAPALHLFVLTTRGMDSGEHELMATHLCLHVLEGLQKLPFCDVPPEFSEAPVTSLPPSVLERIGWNDPEDFLVTVTIQSLFSPLPEDAVTSIAPDPADPRREELFDRSHLLSLRVRSTRLTTEGRPDGRSVLISTLRGRD